MTYSIVLKDPDHPHFGIAVATRHFAVGALVPHLLQGVGAVATQASTNPHLGLQGLDQLARGLPLPEALQVVLDADPDAALRQLHGVDAAGRSWAWTGSGTQPWAGHAYGNHFSVAGNLLAGPDVIEACVRSLEATSGTHLEERLLHALQAGDAAGGDRRGRQSAALLTIRDQPFPWCHLRVDDHPDPLTELARLLQEFRKPYYQDFIQAIPLSN